MSEEVSSIKVAFACMRCGHRVRVPITAVGRQVLCPNCGLALRVPHPGRTDADAETSDGLRLPERAGHARYLEAMEQAAASRSPAPESSNRRRISTLSWVLIAVNTIMLGVVIALVVMWIVKDK